MILGVGVDLCRISPIKRSILRFGDRFSSKFCSQYEREWIEASSDRFLGYAKCFAAKEAFSKALTTGFDDDFEMDDVEITPRYELRFGAHSLRILSRQRPNGRSGDAVTHLSVTRSLDFVSAFVVISC
jgi:holo-[acyl-carrier protein] synthase